MKNNRSPGPDGIVIEMYKKTLHLTLPYLHKLFNEVFNSGHFPSEWANSIIYPVHKKGSVNYPNNYRAISLTDTICKIFVSILNTRLSYWCDKNDIIEEFQAGFRKGYSTSDNIFTLMTLIQKYQSKQNGRFYCIFIDYEKAFDKVKHNELWKALEKINVHGNFLRVLKSIYGNTTACVKTNCGLTKAFKSTVGTRQGCIGSPKIFSIFINDLIKYLKHTCERGIFVSDAISDLFAVLFTDDVASFSDTVARLQKQIDAIDTFSQNIEMKINIDKTKSVVFRREGIIKSTEKWFLGWKSIEIVPF